MKQLLIALMLLPTLVYNAKAQTTIKYVFDGKTLSAPADLQKMKRGDYYKIQIDNINQNLYKISINNKDSIVTKALEMPTFASFSLDAISTLIGGISPKTTTIQRVKIPENGWEGITKSNQPKYRDKTVPSSIGKKMEEYKVKLEAYLTELRRIKTELDELQLKALEYSLNQQKNVPATAVTGYDYAATLAKVQTLRTNVTTVLTNITSSQASYLAYSAANKTAIEKDDDHKNTDGEIKASFTQLLTVGGEAQTALGTDKVKELLTGLINTENNKDRTYTSLPIQFTKEQATAEITIEPRDPLYKLQTYKTSLTFPMERKSYAAVGISFYGATLHDKAFSTVGFPVNDSVTHYRIKKEKLAKAEVGLAALLRMGTKFGKSELWGYHASIGPGISIADKVKPRLLTGIGFSVGVKHMFTFDVGGIFGYVDRLSSAYTGEDEELLAKPENVTVSKLSAGGFASIGYLYKF